MNRTLIYFTLAGVAVVMQTVLLPLLLRGDYKPDLILLLVVYLGLHEGRDRAGARTGPVETAGGRLDRLGDQFQHDSAKLADLRSGPLVRRGDLKEEPVRFFLDEAKLIDAGKTPNRIQKSE